MTTPPAGGRTGLAVAAALRSRFPDVYVNPVGVVIVPAGTTHVAVEIESLGDVELVTMRAPILQDLEGTPELFRHVALGATLFKLGALYLFAEGDRFDLTFETRTFLHWVPADEIPDVLPIVRDTAREQAEALQPLFGGTLPNPSGAARRRVFAEEALGRNKVVSDVLDDALDTHRTAIMGAAEGAWLFPGEAVLGAVVFAMTGTDLWLAGWPRNASRPNFWRFPYAGIAEDMVRREHGATDYLARTTDGRWLGVRVIDPDTADAMVSVRDDPAPYLG